jgi:hypothetical protein
MKGNDDDWAPPGILTARGSNLSIDSSGELYLQHGARIVTVHLSPLQWQLLGLAIARTEGRERGPITLDLLRGTLTIARSSRQGSVVITAGGRGGILPVLLNRSEAGDLYRAARARGPQPTNQGA